METRKAKVIFGKDGHGSTANKIALPVSWVKDLEITENNREVEIMLDNNKIIIERRIEMKDFYEEIEKMGGIIEYSKYGYWNSIPFAKFKNLKIVLAQTFTKMKSEGISKEFNKKEQGKILEFINLALNNNNCVIADQNNIINNEKYLKLLAVTSTKKVVYIDDLSSILNSKEFIVIDKEKWNIEDGYYAEAMIV